jgi:hypothetical protein
VKLSFKLQSGFTPFWKFPCNHVNTSVCIHTKHKNKCTIIAALNVVFYSINLNNNGITVDRYIIGYNDLNNMNNVYVIKK